jgi:hypothetical protein
MRNFLSSAPYRVLVLLALPALIAGCDLMDVVYPRTERFVIRVDSIEVQAAVAPTDTLRVHFLGGLGPNSCSRLERVDRRRSAGSVELTFRGESTRRGQCLQMPSMMKHEEKLVPPFTDPFTIRVVQPGGRRIEKVVRFR